MQSLSAVLILASALVLPFAQPVYAQNQTDYSAARACSGEQSQQSQCTATYRGRADTQSATPAPDSSSTVSTGASQTVRTPVAVPARPGKTVEPEERKIKSGSTKLVCPAGTEKYCDGT